MLLILPLSPVFICVIDRVSGIIIRERAVIERKYANRF